MMKRVRFVKPWGRYSKGAIIEGPWVFVDPRQLIAGGYAEEVAEAAGQIETAMLAPTECTALRPAASKSRPKRKRGRPRKHPIPVTGEGNADGA